MIKIVDVHAIYPVSGVTGFVRGRLNAAKMSTEDIFKCLCARATVIEHVGSKRIKLTLDNYNKVHTAEAAKATVIAAVKEKTEEAITAAKEETPAPVVEETAKVEEPAQAEEPVVEVTSEEVDTKNDTDVAAEETDVEETDADATEEEPADEQVEEKTEEPAKVEVHTPNHKKHKR